MSTSTGISGEFLPAPATIGSENKGLGEARKGVKAGKRGDFDVEHWVNVDRCQSGRCKK